MVANFTFTYIWRSGKFVDIAWVYKGTEKWDFIVDIDFLCEVKNGVILKSLLNFVDFISAISESMSSMKLFKY